MQIAETLRGTFRRHPARWALVAVAVALVAAFALSWFAPWNLFVDRRVDESLPGGLDADDTTEAAGETAGAVADDTTGDEPDAQAGTVTLARGEFVDLEHATTGTVLLLELEDGSRFLRLEDLNTSNGPDLRVVLTDQPVSNDWDVWDDGELVDLGALKGNIGSSNYEIPQDLELSRFQTRGDLVSPLQRRVRRRAVGRGRGLTLRSSPVVCRRRSPRSTAPPRRAGTT